jgi:hypothetical protein
MNCPKCNAALHLQSGNTSMWSCGTEQNVTGIKLSPECFQRQVDACKAEIMDLRAKQIVLVDICTELVEKLMVTLDKIDNKFNEIRSKQSSQGN